MGGLSFPAHFPPSGHTEHACRRDTSAAGCAHTSIAVRWKAPMSRRKAAAERFCLQATSISVLIWRCKPLQNCCLQCNSLHRNATQLPLQRMHGHHKHAPKTRRRQYKCTVAVLDRLARGHPTFFALARGTICAAEYSDVSYGIFSAFEQCKHLLRNALGNSCPSSRSLSMRSSPIRA